MNDRVRFFRSANAQIKLNNIQDMTVLGINATVKIVFKKLRDGGCLPFFMGGSVRDQFLNRDINDVDIQVDCTIERFLQICVREWTSGVTCGRVVIEADPGRELGFIGTMVMNRNIDLGPTAITFYTDISFLEYTVNDLAYDTNGNDVIIDLTGKGADDACNKTIRIPSDDDSRASWDTWLNNTKGSILLRFWKLRTKDFTALNDETFQYITEQAKLKVTRDVRSFPDFYCITVYTVAYSASIEACLAVSADCKMSSKAALYNDHFSRDLGEFWTNQIEPNYLPMCLPDGNTSQRSSASFLTVFILFLLGITLVN